MEVDNENVTGTELIQTPAATASQYENELVEKLKAQTSINDLQDVLMEFILSHLSPYTDLILVKLVSKNWHYLVHGKGTYVL